MQCSLVMQLGLLGPPARARCSGRPCDVAVAAEVLYPHNPLQITDGTTLLARSFAPPELYSTPCALC